MTISQLKTNLAAALNSDECAVFDAFPAAALRPATPFAALGLGSVEVSPLGFGDFYSSGASARRCAVVYTADIYSKTYAACLESLGYLAARAALCGSRGEAPALIISATGVPELRDGLYRLRAEAKCNVILSLGDAEEAEIINLNIDGRISI